MRARCKEQEMAIYFLAVLLVFLILYLFYAVIHPERF
jgi:K+-transporting ATPase KdpF subunit